MNNVGAKALTVLLIISALVITAVYSLPPGTISYKTAVLKSPFAHEIGHQFEARFTHDITSDKQARGTSPIDLLENGKPLGPAHSFEHNIASSGHGAYYHADNSIQFSASDNSDPNTNGRVYSARYPKAIPPIFYIIGFVVLYISGIFLIWLILRLIFPSHSRLADAIAMVLNLFLLVGAIEAAFWALTETRLAEAGKTIRCLYDIGLGEQKRGGIPASYPGLSINYKEHQYLNYCLNPETAYCGVRQFNADYKIRRSETLRADQPPWRALVIGGSTTFCEGVPREEDTWPYQLEKLIRKNAPQAEVINCGVGGYTIVENLIHYVTLLKDLKPNVVILYTGINDVHARLFGNIVSDYSNYRIPWRSESGPFSRASRILAGSYIYRYYFLNYVVFKTLDEGIAGKVSKKGPRPSEWAAALEKNSPETYRRYLWDFIALLNAQNIKVVVIPQYFVSRNKNDELFVKGVKEHNDVNTETAKAAGLPVLGKITAPQVFSAGDTFDNCHFTEAGCKKMAELLYEFLNDNNVTPNMNLQ